jgi:hypothetical protein
MRAIRLLWLHVVGCERSSSSRVDVDRVDRVDR